MGGDSNGLTPRLPDVELRSHGTDPEEWLEGFDQIVPALEREASEGSVKTVLDYVQAYREGTVGWAAGKGRFVLPDGKEMPTRFTLVVHQEDGDWEVVQGFGSIGVPNSEAFGDEL